jgi:hypothetical protein
MAYGTHNGSLDFNMVEVRAIAILTEAARGIPDADHVELSRWLDSWAIRVWVQGSDCDDDGPTFVYFIDGDGDLQGGMMWMDVPTMLHYVRVSDGSWYNIDEDITLNRMPHQGSAAEFNALMENQE